MRQTDSDQRSARAQHDVAAGSKAFRQIDIHFRRSDCHVAASLPSSLRRLATSSFTRRRLPFSFQLPITSDVAFISPRLVSELRKMADCQSSMVRETV